MLVLTMFDGDELVYEATPCGFLLKDIRQHELTDAIRTVADCRSRTAIPPLAIGANAAAVSAFDSDTRD